jgi:hypothetical protein
MHAHQYFCQVEWLADEVLCACPQRSQLLVRLCGDDDHWQVAVRLNVLQSVHDLKTIEARHLQVQQDQVEAAATMQVADRAGVCRRDHARVACATQHLLQQQDVGLHVIDDQDAGGQNIGGTDHCLVTCILRQRYSGTSTPAFRRSRRTQPVSLKPFVLRVHRASKRHKETDGLR